MLWFISLLLLNAHSALGNICCAPQQWEGTNGDLIGFNNHGEDGLARDTITLSYDATHPRLALVEHWTWPINEYNEDKKIIIDYKKNVKYTITENGEKCTKAVPPTSFRAACIPDTARLNGRVTLGQGAHSLNITSYVFYQGNTTSYVSVNDDCFVVTDLTMGTNAQGAGFMDSKSIWDITLGIKSDDVFTVPKVCAGVRMMAVPPSPKKRSLWLNL